MIYLLKQKLEYITGLCSVFLTLTVTPGWVNLLLGSLVSFVIGMFTVICTFFLKKLLESRFANVFKRKKDVH